MAQEPIVPRRTSTSAWASSLRVERHASKSKNYLNLNISKIKYRKSKSKSSGMAPFKPQYVSIASLSTPVGPRGGVATRVNRDDRFNGDNKENDDYSVITQPPSDHDWNQISHVSPLRQQISSALKSNVSPHLLIDNLLSSPSFVLDDQVSFQDKFPTSVDDFNIASYSNSPRGNEVYEWEVDRPILTLEMIINRDSRRNKIDNNCSVASYNGAVTPLFNTSAASIHNPETVQAVEQRRYVFPTQSSVSLNPQINSRRIGDVALSLERIIYNRRLLSVFSSWFKRYIIARDLRESRENQVLSILYDHAERYYVGKRLMKWRAVHRHNMKHAKWRNLSSRTRKGALSILFLSEMRTVWLLTSAIYKFRIFLRKSKKYRKRLIKCYQWNETVAMTEAFGKLARNITYKRDLVLHVVTIHDRVKNVRKQLWDSYMSDYYYTPYVLGLKTKGVSRLKKLVEHRMVSNIKTRKAYRWYSMTYKTKVLYALLYLRDRRVELIERINKNRNVCDSVLKRIWRKWIKKFKLLRRKVYNLYHSFDEADDFYEVALYVRVYKRLIRLLVGSKRKNSGYVDCAGAKHYMAWLMHGGLTQLGIVARNGIVNKQFLVLANHNYETVGMLRYWRVWMQKIYASRRLRRRERYKEASIHQDETNKRVKIRYKNFRQQNQRNIL